MVPRPHLIGELSAATAPLVVLSAPPGAGKTLTVRQWLETDPRPAAWLQLDAGDNDPVTLLHYVARALLTLSPLDPKVLAWLELHEPPVRDVILPELVKAASLAPPFVLVLDDAHAVQNPQCWRVVEALGEASVGRLVAGHLQPQRSSAAFKPSALAGQVVGLRVRRSRLRSRRGRSPARPARPRARRAHGGRPSRGHGRMGGGGVSRRARPGAPATCPRQTLPSGDRRQIADYLTAEVLAGQPPDVVRFLTRTSIVPQLCPDLCVELTGRDDSAQLLEAIEHENLFLSPLDDRREWYRYHHLFRELLEVELRRREPHVLPELHRRAAAWFEAADHVTDAVDHLISAGDVQDAADLAARRWWPFYLSGRVWTARQWVDMFEVDQIADHEQLRVAAAWVFAFTGEASRARGLLAGFEPSAPIPQPYEHATSSHSSVAMLRALLAGEGGLQMRRDARLAVGLEGEGSGPWRSLRLPAARGRRDGVR